MVIAVCRLVGSTPVKRVAPDRVGRHAGDADEAELHRSVLDEGGLVEKRGELGPSALGSIWGAGRGGSRPSTMCAARRLPAPCARGAGGAAPSPGVDEYRRKRLSESHLHRQRTAVVADDVWEGRPALRLSERWAFKARRMVVSGRVRMCSGLYGWTLVCACLVLGGQGGIRTSSGRRDRRGGRCIPCSRRSSRGGPVGFFTPD